MSQSIPLAIPVIDTAVSPTLPEPAGLEAAFNRHRAAALAQPADALSRSRGDAVLARHNLLIGLTNLSGYRALLEQRWRRDRVAALFDGADVTDGAVFAQRRAEGIAAEQKTLTTDIARSYVVRDLLLSPLETAAKFGLVPAERVTAIRVGKGSLDTALDIVSAVAVYREFDKALANKTPVTFELLDEAQKLGNKLVAQITPTKAIGKTTGNDPLADARAEADDLARRFWTLVFLKHGEARMAAREIAGNGFGRLVPALQAAIKAAAPAAAAPAAPAAT